MKNEIILYSPNALTEHIEVRIDEETVWLNRNQIASLFGRDVKTIRKHINNIFGETELEKELVVAKFAITTPHGAIKGKTLLAHRYSTYSYWRIDAALDLLAHTYCPRADMQGG